MDGERTCHVGIIPPRGSSRCPCYRGGAPLTIYRMTASHPSTTAEPAGSCSWLARTIVASLGRWNFASGQSTLDHVVVRVVEICSLTPDLLDWISRLDDRPGIVVLSIASTEINRSCFALSSCLVSVSHHQASHSSLSSSSSYPLSRASSRHHRTSPCLPEKKTTTTIFLHISPSHNLPS